MDKDKPINIIFIGTGDFGRPTLAALVKEKNFSIASVITAPDKKAGRKQLLTPPPIKSEAIKYNLPLLQPQKISDITNQIGDLTPDIIVVAAYAQLLTPKILDIPPLGCLNIHGSLLPKYRGAACVQAAIQNGDKESGITIIKMDAGLDTGPILGQAVVPFTAEDTAGSLSDKLAAAAPALLISAINKYSRQVIKPIAQDDKLASYVKKLTKEDGKIDWGKSAVDLERYIRAMFPWPGAFTFTPDKKMLKIISADKIPLPLNDHSIGKLFLIGSQLAVQCGHDSLVINKLQLAGKKEMTAGNFLLGHHQLIGTVLK